MSIDWKNKELNITILANEAFKDESKIDAFIQTLLGNYSLDINARMNIIKDSLESAGESAEDNDDYQWLSTLHDDINQIKECLKENKAIENNGDLNFLSILANSVMDGENPKSKLIAEIADYYKSDVLAILDDLKASTDENEKSEDYDPNNEIEYYEALGKALVNIQQKYYKRYKAESKKSKR